MAMLCNLYVHDAQGKFPHMYRFLGRYLSFYGRVARLSFFRRSIYLSFAAVVIFELGMLLLINGSMWWWLGIAVATASGIVLCVGNASLMVRRLHDLGWSGYHLIWVGTAEIGSAALSYGPPRAVLLALPLSVVGPWLLFWPGNADANRFGPVPE